jgi:hypothetical protein
MNSKFIDQWNRTMQELTSVILPLITIMMALRVGGTPCHFPFVSFHLKKRSNLSSVAD